jgi:hypothetical protein
MPICASASCSKPGKSRCGRCKSKAYCGRDCQAADFKARHKFECAKLVAYFKSAAGSAVDGSTTDSTTTKPPVSVLPVDLWNHVYTFLDAMALCKVEEACVPVKTEAKKACSVMRVKNHTWRECFEKKFPYCLPGELCVGCVGARAQLIHTHILIYLSVYTYILIYTQHTSVCTGLAKSPALEGSLEQALALSLSPSASSSTAEERDWRQAFKLFLNGRITSQVSVHVRI